MSNAKPKIFVGSARQVEKPWGVEWQLYISGEDCHKMLNWLEAHDQRRLVTVAVRGKQNPVEGKPSHYLELDQWEPKRKEEPQAEPQAETEAAHTERRGAVSMDGGWSPPPLQARKPVQDEIPF
jgi:hypothetical protein